MEEQQRRPPLSYGVYYNSTYRHGVDADGRIMLPMRWRHPALREYVVVEWPLVKPQCLLVIDPTESEDVILEFGGSTTAHETIANMRAKFASQSVLLSAGQRGRLRIPRGQLDRVSIRGEVNLVGLLDRFEIWNPEKYALVRSADALMAAEAFKLMDDVDAPELLYEQRLSSAIVPVTVEVRSFREEVKRFFSRHPEKLFQISPRQFEELVAEILKDMGFDVELTKTTRDGGVDIYAYLRHEVANFLVIVECKQRSPKYPVGVNVVQRLYGIQQTKQANKSMIVTTSYFTQPAKAEARIHEGLMDLNDYQTLKAWLQRYA